MMINGFSNYNFDYGNYVNRVQGRGDEIGSKIGALQSSEECKTCKERKYQDGSNEQVSFKTPTSINPKAVAAAVRAHEGEHVANAYSKAAKDDGEVLMASVSIKTSICTECGKPYVSGGETRTMIQYNNEENPYVQQLKKQQEDALKGMFVDFAL